MKLSVASRSLGISGDEATEALGKGHFIVFAKGAIYVIDPEQARVAQSQKTSVEAWGVPAATWGIPTKPKALIPIRRDMEHLIWRRWACRGRVEGTSSRRERQYTPTGFKTSKSGGYTLMLTDTSIYCVTRMSTALRFPS
ncbi:unnamed protein product [Vitrella brassicaformis CCMP3155]|uniref:Uncharacterized protein n=1 Tax=Vitrella brassicaformis (strain CCMP3155) TaxID=1169540 RepID=A0A0G4FDB8_VITBC|nr:unnamed protein product [Vitrella brassicaformis CCMP3155]|eukprot:CEM11187.1 unnamed protein product [Vitrella brassicaformis CCMP3155]